MTQRSNFLAAQRLAFAQRWGTAIDAPQAKFEFETDLDRLIYAAIIFGQELELATELGEKEP